MKIRYEPLFPAHAGVADYPTQETIIRAAVEIAEVLWKTAVQTPNHVYWIGYEYATQLETSFVQPVGYNLHSGTTGVALFLAALATVTGEDKYAQRALATVQPLRRLLQTASRQRILMRDRMSIGGAFGLASIVYGLTKISTFLNKPALLTSAQHAANLITAERITADTKLDVMDGTAGTLLGLLALYAASPNPGTLQKAIICGEHLLAMRTAGIHGIRAWATINGKLATGFAHGTAGIAYAMLRLYQITKISTLREAALEAIAHEDKFFAATSGNWRNPLEGDESNPVFGQAWCHGAPGIGLARLGAWAILQNADIERSINIALNTTEKIPLQGLDTVCCGNMGRLELLFLAEKMLESETKSREIVGQILTHRHHDGHYQLPHGVQSRFATGFFHGLSGIGYQLLRAIYPQKLSSILLWQ